MLDAGQITSRAAQLYDEFFVPALFAQWAERVAEAAQLQESMRVLDLACGTGVLTAVAAERVGRTGAIVGLDLNPGMLSVARRKAPQIAWKHGSAESLPFARACFDVVVSQFGLMFFADRVVSLEETMRVLRPRGRFVFAVWDALENSPGYAAITDLVARLFGGDTADLLRAPFALGDTERLRALFAKAGCDDVDIETVGGEAHFPSLRAWIHSDVRGWTLGSAIDDDQFEQLVAAAEDELSRFVGSDGEVRFPLSAHLVLGRSR